MRLWLRAGRIMALIGLAGTLEGDPGGELAMAQRFVADATKCRVYVVRWCIDGGSRGF